MNKKQNDSMLPSIDDIDSVYDSVPADRRTENSSDKGSSQGEDAQKKSKSKLNIYLLKPWVHDPKDALRDTVSNYPTTLPKYKNVTVFQVGQKNAYPDWARLFFKGELGPLGYLSFPRNLCVISISIDGQDRLFALVFGNTRQWIKEEAIEEQFGLKTVLNSVGGNDIRKITKSCVGTNLKRTEEQMPRASSISEFDFDVTGDLIGYVSAKVKDDLFGNAMITGGDSLSVSVPEDISTVSLFLERCYRRYRKDDYKQNFPWIDNIKAVKNDTELVAALDEALLQIVKEKRFDLVWMAVPEVLKWEDVGYIQIQGDKAEYDDVDIEAVMNSFRNEVDVSKLKHKTIKACSRTDTVNSMAQWNAYRCLCGNVEYKGRQFCISDGKWYEIDVDYAANVERQYNEISLCTLSFPKHTMGESEDAYNARLASALENAVELHKLGIALGGGKGNTIEPCDVYMANTFIHVKKGDSSSNLSHLFNQGLVSAGMLRDSKIYEVFKAKAIKRIRNNGSTATIPEKLSETPKVIFGIYRSLHSSFERPSIPFFSKATICSVEDKLRQYGYKLELKHIENVDAPA